MKKLLLAFLSSSLLVAENEFDLMLDKYNDIKAGDIIETFKDVEEQVSL